MQTKPLRHERKTAAIMKELAGPASVATLRHMDRRHGSAPGEIESGIPTDGAKYYFHVGNGRQYLDETGQMFPSQREAVAHGAVLAAELAQDGDWDSFAISVADANGRVIAWIPVRK
jgi:hypothetical protein